MESPCLAIIGGTGLYELPGLDDIDEHIVDTPFGKPSSPIISGKIAGVKLLFIARHGLGHVWTPSEINYRANIFAIKKLGAQWCMSVSAVGSLQEEIAPGDAVIPDQFIDRTKGRISTFFGEGICAHVSLADPFCPVLSQIITEAAEKVSANRGIKIHGGGTYVCIEGPSFSTRAESNMYRSWNAKIVGMTNLTEARLAREAEIAYATLAVVTDYDCWRSDGSDVSVDQIMAILKNNVSFSKDVILESVAEVAKAEPSEIAAKALQHAIITSRNNISSAAKTRLQPIIGKYLK